MGDCYWHDPPSMKIEFAIWSHSLFFMLSIQTSCPDAFVNWQEPTGSSSFCSGTAALTQVQGIATAKNGSNLEVYVAIWHFCSFNADI